MSYTYKYTEFATRFCRAGKGSGSFLFLFISHYDYGFFFFKFATYGHWTEVVARKELLSVSRCSGFTPASFRCIFKIPIKDKMDSGV